jgi:hypothetical protein
LHYGEPAIKLRREDAAEDASPASMPSLANSLLNIAISAPSFAISSLNIVISQPSFVISQRPANVRERPYNL